MNSINVCNQGRDYYGLAKCVILYKNYKCVVVGQDFCNWFHTNFNHKVS